MSDTYRFATLVLLVAGAGLLAVLSNRLTERIKVPAPLLVLVAAAVGVNAVPDLHVPSELLVERLVTLALICILFDGGLHMGWPRFRAAAAPIAILGVLGTFLTVAAAAAFLPSFVNMLAILPVLDRVRQMAWMKATMRGMSPAVIGVLAVSLARLSPAAIPDPLALLILIGTIAASLALRAGAFKPMLGGAVVGIVRGWLPASVLTRPF